MSILLRIAPAALAAAMLAAPVAAAPAGSDAGRCAPGAGPAFLVQITGLKNRQGTVRVRLFGGSPDSYFDRERALVRIQIPTPPGEPVHVCVPVPRPGTYALDVRHDVNGDDRTDMADGGGTSGNPRPSMWAVITRKKPSPTVTQVTIASGVRVVPITMLYMRGGRPRAINE